MMESKDKGSVILQCADCKGAENGEQLYWSRTGPKRRLCMWCAMGEGEHTFAGIAGDKKQDDEDE